MEDQEENQKIDQEDMQLDSSLTPESTPLEENEADLEIAPPKSGKATLFGPKEALKKLLKMKMTISVTLIGICLLVLIVFFAVNESTGVNDYKYWEGACKSVTIDYEPYNGEKSSQTMDIEKYVDAAVYAYTKDIPNQDEGTYHVYKSLAIALRTEAVVNDCKITYRDKELTEKPEDGPNMKILNKALESSRGVIVTRRGGEQLLDVHVSDFCYEANNGENYTLFAVPNFYIPTDWVNEFVNNDIYRNCPCNQPDESQTECWITNEETGESSWAHQDDRTGYSVYGAVYLLEKRAFNYDDILQFLIGNHSFWSIDENNKVEDDENNSDTLCSSMELDKTLLTKKQFVDGMKNYNYQSSSARINDSWKLFQEKAEDIYDISVANNVNPEWVVARALAEGFPYPPYNNYWGYGCYNTQSIEDCKNYGSDFNNAVAEFCKDMTKGYSSWDDVLMHYAVLGEYWYNPGNDSLGGCNYINQVYPEGAPQKVVEACQSGRYCGAEGGSNCVPTTIDEQKRYGTWAQRVVLKFRKEIWGLEENDCSYQKNGAGCMWWPIGSRDTEESGGLTFAKGNPETTTITSQFGKRSAPTASASTYHKAIDIGGGVEGKTNIIAAADGEVTNVFTGCTAGNRSCGGRLGNAVYITHSDGTQTRYGHMYSVSVKIGDKVKQGQVIGKLGNTGDSTGPHLDFQVIVGGEAVNPLNYVSASEARTKCFASGGIIEDDDNKKSICKTLKNNGYSDEAVAGIMGNLYQESNFLPTAVNSQGCSGIAQWCDSRLNNLKNTYGSSWQELGKQLEFILYELQNSFASAERHLRANSDVETHTQNFCLEYEKPGGGCSSRQEYALDFYDYVKNGCQ